MSKKETLRPDDSEKQFLQLAYNRFYDLFDEIDADSFWQKDELYRFAAIRECFLIYSEILNHEPIQWVIKQIRESRPPMEAEIGKEYFGFIRNLLVHFPFFTKWSEVYFNKSLINWCGVRRSIDKFLSTYEGHSPIKYRVWCVKRKEFTYVTIGFARGYLADKRIYLSSMLPEKEGAVFSLAFMKNILDTQVEK
jgi:hypothetical protein